MKLASSVVISTLCWSARLASAATAHVYTFDSQPSEGSSTGVLGNLISHLKLHGSDLADPSRTLSPAAARAILAQRAGADDFYAANLADPGVLEAVNEYGLKSPLFGSGDVSRTLVLAELTEETHPSMKHASGFAFSPAPSFDSARQFINAIDEQRSWRAISSAIHDLKRNSLDFDPHSGFSSIRGSRQELEQFWHSMVESTAAEPKARKALTMVVFPSPAAQNEGEYQENAAWTNAYNINTYHQALHKRQQDDFQPTAFSSVDASTSPFTTLQDDENKSSPLPGILPACFATQSTCESTTRNCTGHGSCKLSYIDNTYPEPRHCYACSCSATVVTDDQGRTSTTYWGGPACQKRDVSMQFWLIALFTVGLIGLISFAVGTLWSMGEETLPSVIGAGVSGPSARR